MPICIIIYKIDDCIDNMTVSRHIGTVRFHRKYEESIKCQNRNKGTQA